MMLSVDTVTLHHRSVALRYGFSITYCNDFSETASRVPRSGRVYQTRALAVEVDLKSPLGGGCRIYSEQ